MKMNGNASVSARIMIGIVAVVLFLMPLAVAASEVESLYLEGARLYNQGNYEKAAGIFESIARRHVVNGDLYYNLGNAFYKKGDLGRSMLWYERALKIMPGDPDLIFNHHLVNGMLVDRAEIGSNPVLDVFLFWKHRMSARTVTFTAMALFWLFTAVSLIRTFRPVHWLRYPERILLGFSLLFIVSACYDYCKEKWVKEAVVISDNMSVRSGFSEDATELFRLHTGTKVQVDEALRDYVKIRFSDSKIGWVEKKNIEII
jgi:tetratricopeptide (TPR) repeat protein